MIEHQRPRLPSLAASSDPASIRVTRPETVQQMRDAVAGPAGLSLPNRDAIVRDLDDFMRTMAVADLPANGNVLHSRLQRLASGSGGKGVKRGKNMRSNIRAALAWRRARRDRTGLPRRQPMTPEWASLYAHLQPDSFARRNISRFARWCSANGIPPADVDTATLLRFLDYLMETSACNVPHQLAKQVALAWRIAAKNTPGWPASDISLPRKPGYGVPRDAFAPEFLADLDAYVAAVTGEPASAPADPFSEDEAPPGSGDAYKRTTAKTRQTHLRIAAQLLAASSGKPLTGIKSLAELVAPGAAKTILSQYFKKFGHHAPSIHFLAVSLKEMAKRHLPYDLVAQDRLARLIATTQAPLPGLTEKNRTRLRRIGKEELAGVFALPYSLVQAAVERAKDKWLRPRDLVDAQVGVSMAILLHAPVRIANLAVSKLGKNIELPENVSKTGRIFYSKEIVKKGRKEVDLPLPPDATAVVRLYVDEVLSRWKDRADVAAMFPGKVDTKGSITLSTQISARIKLHLGLDINPHLFRHLCGYIHLVRNPGDYHTVQLLLNHAKVETTKNYYCGAEAEAALQHFAGCLAALKAELGLDPRNMSRIGAAMHRGNRKPSVAEQVRQ